MEITAITGPVEALETVAQLAVEIARREAIAKGGGPVR